MQIPAISYSDARPIDGYGPGFFRVGGEAHNGSIIVTASSVLRWDGFDDSGTPAAIKDEIDVLLVGTGKALTPLPAAFRDNMEALGIGVEPMATQSACRTFNLLLAEGRRVAAALLPI